MYLAENLKNNKLYAVKAFQKSHAYQGHNGKAGIDNEIQILRKFNHPNIPVLHGVY